MLPRTIEVAMDTGCMLWEGEVKDGYGVMTIKGKKVRMHRLMWEKYKGEIEPGKELHHVCGNRRCCNPEHLMMVTHNEHMALHPNGPFTKKDRCKHGHEFTLENTLMRSGGGRACKECSRLKVRKWRKRHLDKWREMKRVASARRYARQRRKASF
jgi:HNH endonuclease